MERKRLSWGERGWLWFRLGLRLGLGTGSVWLAVRYGRAVLTFSAPFLAALTAAVLLDRPVRWLQRRLGWSRRVLTAALLLLLFGALGVAAGWIAFAAGGELVSLAQNWDGLLDKLQSALAGLETFSGRLWRSVPPQLHETAGSIGAALLDWVSESIPAALNALLDRTTETAMGLPSFLVALTMFVMSAYLLTADFPYLRIQAVQRLGDRSLDLCRQLRATALGAFGGYLKAQILLSVGVFFLLLTGFLLTRQPYGLLLALGLAVLDFIPVVGAGTVMIPWAAAAMFTRDYATVIRMLSIWGVIAVFRRVMEPKIIGDQTGLSPLLSLVSIYAGMKLAGVWGMILSPILVLMGLNLIGMGLFRGFRLDLTAALEDAAAILSERPGETGG